MNQLTTFVDGVFVGPEVSQLQPGIAMLVIAIDGISNGPSDNESRAWLQNACASSAEIDHEQHLEAWRAAYRAAGMKPQKFRPSFDALLRRSSTGLPEVNKIVDAYNAVSVKYGLPIGGENLDAYSGQLRLVRASGEEAFDTVASGEPVVEVVDADEVIWRDDLGATCRRWNWRQGVRTRVDVDTQRVFFLLESLAPFSLDRLHQAGDELVKMVKTPGSSVVSRLIKP